MSIDILLIEQAPSPSKKRRSWALTLVACAERGDHDPDDETVRWLHERCASVLTGEQVTEFLESLIAGSGHWRSVLADVARAGDRRATLISTHALVNPFLRDEDGIPWLRLDACSDSFGGFVDAITLSNEYERVHGLIRSASPARGTRRAVHGVSGALAFGAGSLLTAYGMGGAVFKTNAA